VSAEDQIKAVIGRLCLQASQWRLDENSGQLVPVLEPSTPVPLTASFSTIGTDEGEFGLSTEDVTAVVQQQRRQIRYRACVLPGNCDVFVAGPVAWVVDQPTLVRDQRPRVRLRLTAILLLEEGEWRLAHVHFSAGVRNEELWGHRLTTSIEDLASSAQAEGFHRLGGSVGAGLTIVFTDITSSTSHMIRIGDENWLDLVRWHNWKVREAVVEYGGNEVKSQGDGFMLAFDTVERALDCMLSLLSTFAQPAGSWDPEELSVRIGAHTGPTSRDLGDYYGTAVVTAARIAENARAGEALVSDAIAKAAAGYEFANPRQMPLKGLPGTHFVYPLVRRSPH
jgi:class 3 adenylate cyclase